jgi:inorganic pyrophosphatase
LNWTDDFWMYLQRLVSENQLVIDRPRGTPHPRYPEMIYPLDYGYLQGTTTVDGGGIDVWRGTSQKEEICGLLCTVDLRKEDAEIKIVLGCTELEVQEILQFHNADAMRAIFIKKKGLRIGIGVYLTEQ